MGNCSGEVIYHSVLISTQSGRPCVRVLGTLVPVSPFEPFLYVVNLLQDSYTTVGFVLFSNKMMRYGILAEYLI
jgi:hypothetical protein